MEKVNSLILENGKINNLIIDNTKANYKFYINPQEKDYKGKVSIDNIQIKDSSFLENFKLHHAEISKFEMEDVDFEKNADFYKTIFKKGILEEDKEENTSKEDIGFKAINFKKLALFGDTEFHKKAIFRYVTFEGHNHFKSSKLFKGIDLEYTNIQQEINFFDIEIIDTTTTSQETYRIIKHQFEKLGNKIEANKYHALELEQKGKTLNEEKADWKERLVFNIHNWSSEHSTNWLLALLWIVVVGFTSAILTKEPWFLLVFPMTYLLSVVCFEKLTSKLWFFIFIFSILLFFDNNLKLKSVMDYMAIINLINSDFVLIKNYHKDNLLGTWDAVVLFLNKISLGYLYYQFLMSVRKDTRK